MDKFSMGHQLNHRSNQIEGLIFMPIITQVYICSVMIDLADERNASVLRCMA